MTNTISHPLTKTMSISEAEKEISKCTDGTPIAIIYLENTTETSESIEDLSVFRHPLPVLIGDIIKAGKSTELTKFIEYQGIPKSTPVTVTPTQIDLTIKFDDPIISILAHFKRMCNRRLKEMLDAMKNKKHPKSEQEAINDTIVGIYRNWDSQGGFRDTIAKIKGVEHNDIKCDLFKYLGDQRNSIEHKGHNPTKNDVEDFVRKVQKLTLKDIKIPCD